MKRIFGLLAVLFCGCNWAAVVPGPTSPYVLSNWTTNQNATLGYSITPTFLSPTNRGTMTLMSIFGVNYEGVLSTVAGKVTATQGATNGIAYWSGPGGTGGLANSLGSTAAGTNGQRLLGTGGIPAWGKEPFVIVTDPPYNADSTGVLDSYSAFTNALATKLTVLVPDGTYKITNSITLNTNQTLLLMYSIVNLYTNTIYIQSQSSIIGISPGLSTIVSTRTNGYVIGAPAGYGALSFANIRNISVSGSGPAIGLFMDAWTSCTVDNVEVDFFSGTNGLGYGFYGLGTTNGDCSQNHFSNLAAKFNDHGLVFSADSVGAICGYNRVYGIRIQQGQRGIELLSPVVYGSINNHFYDVFIQGHTSSTNNGCAVLIEGDNNSIFSLNFDVITGTNLLLRPVVGGSGATGNYIQHMRNHDLTLVVDDSVAGPGNHIDTMNNFLFSPYRGFDFQDYGERLFIDMATGINMQWRMPGTLYMTNAAWSITMVSNNAPALNFYGTNGIRMSLTQSGYVGINTTLPSTDLYVYKAAWPGFVLDENGSTKFGFTVDDGNFFLTDYLHSLNLFNITTNGYTYLGGTNTGATSYSLLVYPTGAILVQSNMTLNTGHFLPGTNITSDLGSAARYWRTNYVDTLETTNLNAKYVNILRTTDPAYLNAVNTGGSFYVGKEGSAADNVMIGDVAYASVLNSAGQAPIMFGVNDSLVMTMATNNQITVTGNMGAVMTAGNTNVLNLNLATTTIIVTNAITFASATNGVASVHKSQVCWFVAGGAGPYTLTLPSWRTNMAQTVCAAITNGVVTKMIVESIGTCADAATQTNCYVSFEYFK